MSKQNKETAELSLEEQISALLKKHDLTVTTAESCTGGWIIGRLVNAAGISSQLNEGYITYSNEAKERILGVSHDILEIHGAVSRQTAAAMAAGVRKTAGADIAVVSTGIAGPGGGTKAKPVGLVYLACSYLEHTVVEEHTFPGCRMQVREAAVEAALQLLIKTISEYTIS